nr:uncharacterized protein LOC118878065 [Drosophila suzukii]
MSPFNDASKQASANKTVTVSLNIPIIAELYQKMNLIKCSSKAAQDAHDLIKIRIKERFYHYESRTVPRIATLLDPRFKKEGFFLPLNAEQAAKALELKLYEILSMNSNASSTAPAPPEPSFYLYLQCKLSNKVTLNRADSIILMRQYFEQKTMMKARTLYYTGR